MSTSHMTKQLSQLVAMLLIVAILGTFAGCSDGDSLVGEYTGTSGSFLKLNKDGTCIYAEDDSTGTGTGTWYVEDDMLYIEVSNLDYVVYADVSEADEGILLESNAGSWNDEYFQKKD